MTLRGDTIRVDIAPRRDRPRSRTAAVQPGIAARKDVPSTRRPSSSDSAMRAPSPSRAPWRVRAQRLRHPAPCLRVRGRDRRRHSSPARAGQHRSVRSHRRESLSLSARRAALDLLRRRRPRLVRQRPTVPRSRRASAEGRRAHRGAGELLPVRRRRARARRRAAAHHHRGRRRPVERGARSRPHRAARDATSTCAARRRPISSSSSTCPAR